MRTSAVCDTIRCHKDGCPCNELPAHHWVIQLGSNQGVCIKCGEVAKFEGLNGGWADIEGRLKELQEVLV